MVNDPISDMINRIKNMQAVGKLTVMIPASKDKVRVAEVLKSNGYIDNYRTIEEKPVNQLEVTLKPGIDTKVISHFRRASKPGRRFYVKCGAIPRPLSGFGLAIVSTSKGIMSGRKAQELGLGGEVIATVW